jgi:hypothetical protein
MTSLDEKPETPQLLQRTDDGVGSDTALRGPVTSPGMTRQVVVFLAASIVLHCVVSLWLGPMISNDSVAIPLSAPGIPLSTYWVWMGAGRRSFSSSGCYLSRRLVCLRHHRLRCVA